jgi:hypothetical protein
MGVAALASALLLDIAPALAIDCPDPQQGRPGVIKETPAQISELGPVLAGSDVTAQIPAIVDGLRKRYPAAGSAELVNYLITAYCPAVDKSASLSEPEKTARVQAFAKAVLGVLY